MSANKGGRPPTPLSVRLEARVNRRGPVPEHAQHLGRCHVWEGSVGSHGYGQIGQGRRMFRVHRAAFFLAYGRWPSSCLLHLCDNKLCVRPQHLREGTIAENNRDMIEKDRHCRGSRHRLSKLKEADIPRIRKAYASGVRIATIAQFYGVSRAAAHSAATKRTWAHVEDT